MPPSSERRIKSLKTWETTQVKFINKSPRRVRVIWLNFEGKPEWRRYNPKDGLKLNKSTAIQTYLMHPWIFKDHLTGDKIYYKENETETREVYYPKLLPDGLSVLEVELVLPVYSLKQRCLQVMRRLVKQQHVCKLDIPHTLKNEILKPDFGISDQEISLYMNKINSPEVIDRS
ncbi:von Hippel-Lindau disease tumor suppressor-like [Anneissia japonica]|uniref:von Hippel-Lindau disease tumor suppressor-like n=1 Tax=Anneissia japonica TaxID=1529436 RepID=UPI0014258633|nr:von Hippel-Lindau disease tumor suppressor-like [Anneissia japonica]